MDENTSRSLLIGASGQIGAQILHLLPQQCLVTSRHAERPGELPLDLASLAAPLDAERALEVHSLDAIYCIAGMTNVEGCEDTPELAHFTNCRGPALLAGVASQRRIPFVYFSTEYVFDGLDGPYYEDDPTNPLSVYGKSKREGELAVLAACPHALILRTTVVYGQDFGQKNFVYSLIRTLSAGKTMRVPEDQISTPTYNRDLAAATVALVDRRVSGIFHACGPERMDRLEFARAVADFLSLDSSLIVGVPTSILGQKAPRPLSAGLATDKLRNLHADLQMRPLVNALSDCRTELQDFVRACGTLATNR